MVLPSRFEGLPLVVIEWQINGLPCLLSDAVTRDCKIFDNVEFESLEDSDIEWLNSLENVVSKGRNCDSAIIRKCLTDAGFDIAHNAKELERIYLSM